MRGIAGLHVPETGIVDYKAVTAKYGELASSARRRRPPRSQGASPFIRAADEIVLETRARRSARQHLINCGGLQADRVARLCGLDPGL